MKSNIKKSMRILLFVLVILLINQILLMALKPYNFFRNDMHNIKTKKYDDIFVGTSHGKAAIHPDEVDKITGRNSVNMCLGGQFPLDSYYIVKEACRTGNPKRVIYEVDPGYWMIDPPLGPEYITTYDEFKWSRVKVEYFKDKMAEIDFRASIFPWFVYRQGYRGVYRRLKERLSEPYLTYDPTFYNNDFQSYNVDGSISINRMNAEKAVEDIVVWKGENFKKESEEYLSKLIDYCKKQNIEFIAITTPVPDDTLRKYSNNFRDANQYFATYFEKQNVSYYNYNYITTEGLDTTINGFMDYDGHMYEDEARLFSKELGRYLNN